MVRVEDKSESEPEEERAKKFPDLFDGSETDGPLLDFEFPREPEISVTAYNAIKKELQQCKNTITSLRLLRWNPEPPEKIIKSIIFGEPYSLETCKSLADKFSFLDMAIYYYDGNAITAILIFLKRTLKPSIFAKNLKTRPVGLNHFIRYLENLQDWKTLLNLYKELYRTEDAMMLQYRCISKLQDPKKKLQEIDKILSEYRNAPKASEILVPIEEERKLLARQMEIEEEDKESEKQGKNAVLRYHPRTASIQFKPLITTLYYCAFYHFRQPESPFHPSSIRKEFKLSGKQYEWSVLTARARLHDWRDIAELLTASSWLKRKVEKSEIGFDKVAEILHKYGAPKQTVQNYIDLIGNLELKLKAASTCQCHEVAIDTIVVMKDREMLEKYRDNVKFDGKLRQKIQNLLADNTIRWK